jgi:hypothetical protein
MRKKTSGASCTVQWTSTRRSAYFCTDEDCDRRFAERFSVPASGLGRNHRGTEGDDRCGGEVIFDVGLSLVRFPNGGSWSFFLCPCGRRARIIRLFEGGLACRQCLGDRGLRPRVQLIATHKRAAYIAPRLIARLTSTEPARLHPRPGRMLDRRVKLELSLRRASIVVRQYALDEHAKMLKR